MRICARSPGEDFTAKDFRTWAGTVLAALALAEFEQFDDEAKAKKNIRAAIESVSSRLGNTPTICRKCYVHPEILSCYLDGDLLLDVKEEVEAELRDRLDGLKPEEAAVLTLLKARLDREIARGAATLDRRQDPRKAPSRRSPDAGTVIRGRHDQSRFFEPRRPSATLGKHEK